MSDHTDKAQAERKQVISGGDSILEGEGESGVQFADNRPEAIAQRRLQEHVNASDQVSQLRALQARVNMSLQSKKIAGSDLSAEAQSFSHRSQKNKTGLPERLRSGLEKISGYSLSDVSVYYNSAKPAQLQAHAFAQGSDIHLGPGQEKHLPHEAWHVVQQKQGRVQATMQSNENVGINDDPALEKEADIMGTKAVNYASENSKQELDVSCQNENGLQIKTEYSSSPAIQRQLIVGGVEQRTVPELSVIQDNITVRQILQNWVENGTQNYETWDAAIEAAFQFLVQGKPERKKNGDFLSEDKVEELVVSSPYEGLILGGLMIQGDTSTEFSYYWGGTGKIEAELRKINPDDHVNKSEDATTGLRILTQSQFTFREVPSPFPISEKIKFQKLDENDVKVVEQLANDFKVESKAGRSFISEMFLMNKVEKEDSKNNIKTLRRILTMLEKDLEKEQMSIDQGLAIWKKYGLYTILSQAKGDDPVVELIDKRKGLSNYTHDSKLTAKAQSLAEDTDILKCKEWNSARTDAEFEGLIGERLSHLSIEKIMPSPIESDPKTEGKVMHLHSVHFIGDIYRGGQLYKKNLDVTSELDLLSVILQVDGTYTYYAIGNTKISGNSLVGAAKSQNDDAEIALEAHASNQKANYGGKNEETAEVKKVFGRVVKSNTQIELTGKLKKGTDIKKVTVGAKGASGEYDKRLDYTTKEIATLVLILREIEKNAR